MPPLATRMSLATPRAGCAVIPLNASLPPQLRASFSPDTGNCSRPRAGSLSRVRSTASTPIRIASSVPPASWIPTRSSGISPSSPRPARASRIVEKVVPSQPSPTTTAPTTFGWKMEPARVRLRSRYPADPIACAHPIPWASGTIPWTPAARRSRSMNRRQIALTTVAEQLTEAATTT